MIIGHQKQWQILIKEKVFQSFLFSGQESLGKKKVSLELAKYLKCESKNKPCQKCSSCLSIEKRINPDFFLLEPEKDIKIDQIREIKRKMFLSSDSYKITIIDRAHLMTKESQNSFLKILEEPKKNTIFILITEYPDLLLDTILSRVQQIKFFPVSKEKMQEYGFSPEILKLSFNKPGLALKMSSHPEIIKEYKKRIEELEDIKKMNMAERFQKAKQLCQSNLSEIFYIWLYYLRALFLEQNKNNQDYKKTKTNIKNLQNIISLVERTNINIKLATELLLIKIK